MDDCSSTCQRMAVMDKVSATSQVIEAAEKLACLLIENADFQNFMRLSRAVRVDRQVNELMSLLNGFGGEGVDQGSGLQSDTASLEDQLESLPVVVEYRQAERGTKAVFSAVENAITAAAGLPFAENAQPSACG